MSFESNLLASTNYSSLYSVLQDRATFRLKLDPNFGWEKIKMDSGEEYFNIERVTLYISELSGRKNLDKAEIEDGKKVCDIFLGLWEQLDEQLNALNCMTGSIYRAVHFPSSAYYSDCNPAWIDFWQDRNIVLKRSWGIFDAELNLTLKSKLV